MLGMKKEDVPLIVLQSFQKIKKSFIDRVKNDSDIKIQSEDLLSINIISSKPDSKFYFSVLDSVFESGVVIYTIECAPSNEKKVDSTISKTTEPDVLHLFATWYNILKTYNSIPNSVKENILNANQERLIREYVILDEDASNTSFNWHQQIYLDGYLESTIAKLELMKNLDNCSAEIEPLQMDAIKIKSIITTETKKEVIERLSRFWAKAQVIGLEIFKEIFVSYMAELTTKLLQNKI